MQPMGDTVLVSPIPLVRYSAKYIYCHKQETAQTHLLLQAKDAGLKVKQRCS
jgi:hypothetical protein